MAFPSKKNSDKAVVLEGRPKVSTLVSSCVSAEGAIAFRAHGVVRHENPRSRKFTHTSRFSALPAERRSRALSLFRAALSLIQRASTLSSKTTGGASLRELSSRKPFWSLSTPALTARGITTFELYCQKPGPMQICATWQNGPSRRLQVLRQGSLERLPGRHAQQPARQALSSDYAMNKMRYTGALRHREVPVTPK